MNLEYRFDRLEERVSANEKVIIELRLEQQELNSMKKQSESNGKEIRRLTVISWIGFGILVGAKIIDVAELVKLVH